MKQKMRMKAISSITTPVMLFVDFQMLIDWKIGVMVRNME